MGARWSHFSLRALYSLSNAWKLRVGSNLSYCHDSPRLLHAQFPETRLGLLVELLTRIILFKSDHGPCSQQKTTNSTAEEHKSGEKLNRKICFVTTLSKSQGDWFGN